MWATLQYPFDAHCCHMGTAVKHHVPEPDRVKPSFVIFGASKCPDVKNYKVTAQSGLAQDAF